MSVLAVLLAFVGGTIFGLLGPEEFQLSQHVLHYALVMVLWLLALGIAIKRECAQ